MDQRRFCACHRGGDSAINTGLEGRGSVVWVFGILGSCWEEGVTVAESSTERELEKLLAIP